MSDFGSHVVIYRVDGREPSDDEVRRIRAAAQSLQFAAVDRVGPYDEFDLSFGGTCSAEGVEGFAVFLSSYFVEDEEANNEFDPEVIIAREAPVAAQFAEDLQRLLGNEFEVFSYSGDH